MKQAQFYQTHKPIDICPPPNDKEDRDTHTHTQGIVNSVKIIAHVCLSIFVLHPNDKDNTHTERE